MNTTDTPADRIRIYFWPNLMTAGNLFCGFLALTKIVEADAASADFYGTIRTALYLILLACIFDLLDGRVARIGGYESPFGREFDSLADIVSFGAAPAFLVHRIVLRDVFEQYAAVGWLIASVYLICGAMRLARFNCLAALPETKKSDEFLGFPIPMAAGLVASLTYFIMWWDERSLDGTWRYALPVVLVFLSFMMVSEVKYPAFKSIDLRTRRTFTKMVVSVLLIGGLFILGDIALPIVLPVIFTAYLVYGFVRPHISKRMRKEIEQEIEDDPEDILY
jgi:CDP-diacylglycerol--serine O-phosphatidyltransferase